MTNLISAVILFFTIAICNFSHAQTQGFQWVKTLEENQGELLIKDIKTNSTGNMVVICGQFRGYNIDFDPGPGNMYRSSNSELPDIYVARYTTSGALVNVITIGGSYDEVIRGLSIDKDDNIIIAGLFQGSNIDFNPGSGTRLLSSSFFDRRDIFVAKFTNLLQLVYAYSIPGEGSSNSIRGVVTDASGNIYIAGNHDVNARGTNSDFDVGSGVSRPTGIGIYIAKYNASFGFQWIKSIGGRPSCDGIQIDAEGNIIIHGTANYDNIDFDPGPGTTNIFGDFIAKYNSSGNFLWAIPQYKVSLVTTDAQSNIIYVGKRQYTDSQVSLIKRSKTNAFLWSVPVPSSTGLDLSYVNSLTVDPSSNIYLSGSANNSWDFDPGSGVVNIMKDISETSNISFIAKYAASSNLMWVFGNEKGSYSTIYADKFANLYVSAKARNGVDLVDYDPGIIDTRSPSSRSLVKYGQCFPAPAPVVEGNLSVCTGSSTVLSVAGSQLFESSQWRWYSGPCGGTLLGTGASITLNPSLPATYSVRAEGGCFDPNQCTSFFVNVSSNVVPTINIVPRTRPSDEKCFGEEVEYKASITYGGTSPMYQWKLNNVNVGSNSDKLKLNFREGDKIKCVLTSNATCATQTTITSNERTVVVSPRPAPPDITQSGDTLFSSYPVGNQWYEEGVILPGENGKFYVMDLTYGTFPKQYSVVYTDSKGCSREEKIRIYGPTSTYQAIRESIVLVYPNPTSNILFINPVKPIPFTYEIWNIHGQLIYQGTSSGLEENYSLANLSNGLYIIKIIQEEKVVNYKIVKQ